MAAGTSAAGVVSVCKDCASTTGKGGLLAVEILLTGINSIHLESYSISRRKEQPARKHAGNILMPIW